MMLKHLAACLLLVGCALTARAKDTVGSTDQALAQEIASALVQEGLAGSVWSTVDADGTIRTGAAGYRNAPAREAMTPDTKVHIGSVTKTLLATGVLQLVSAGRLDLDTPVGTLLPQLRFDNPWERESPVRVRHLLDQTAGLEDARLWQVFSLQTTPDAPLIDAFTRDATVLQVRSRPGERFSYSNMGYTLAGMVIEAVTDERYERWLDRELLAPLGMRDSSFAFVSQAGATPDPRLAWGHQDDLSVHAAVPTQLRPAGQFTTTAHDMALLARFLMSDGRIDGRPIVRTDLLRAMATPNGTAAANAGLQVGDALGLTRRDRHGAVGHCRGGSIVGFRAMLCLFPESRRAFTLVHNADVEGADYNRFDALMVKAMDLPPATPAAARAPAADIGQWQGHYVPAPNRMAMFRYVDFLADSVRVDWDGATLKFAPLQAEARSLVPAGGHLFVADGRAIPSHVLLSGEQGEKLIADGGRTYRKASTVGYWLMWASLGLGVIGLLWFLLAVPIRGAISGRAWRQPGFWGAVALLLPVPLFFTQSFMQLGDRTPASIAVYLAGLVLPLAMAWQLAIGVRRWRLAREWADTFAALLVLQWCAMLFAWDMLPFAMWR
ncbi:MAG TPA: serine hydrolase domain-containing protein [Lysobacter sp.]